MRNRRLTKSTPQTASNRSITSIPLLPRQTVTPWEELFAARQDSQCPVMYVSALLCALRIPISMAPVTTAKCRSFPNVWTRALSIILLHVCVNRTLPVLLERLILALTVAKLPQIPPVIPVLPIILSLRCARRQGIAKMATIIVLYISARLLRYLIARICLPIIRRQISVR